MPNKRNRARGESRQSTPRGSATASVFGRSWFGRQWHDVQTAYSQWVEHDGTLLASAVAYYMALSFFPLLLVLIAALGLFFRLTHVGQDAERQVFEIISQHFSAGLEQQVRDAFAQVRAGAAYNGPLGVLALLLAAMAIFAQIERGFARIWHKETSAPSGVFASVKEIVFGRLRAFFMLLALGAVLLAIFVAGLVLSTLQRYSAGVMPAADPVWRIAGLGLNVLLNAAVFCLLYRTLSKAQVRWREALQGGIVASTVWEIGRQILSSYLVGSRYDSAYGVIGSFIAVMLWVYYGVTVLFLGAEYVAVISQRRQRTLP